MYLEHLVFTFALAILVGMVYNRITGRDPTWVIVFGTILPDVDSLIQYILFYLTGNFYIIHGDFHTLGALIVVPCIFAVILTRFNVRFFDGYICLAIGFIAHIVEDLSVYNGYTYKLLLPYSYQVFNTFGFVNSYRPNILGLFMGSVTTLGLFLVAVAIFTRYCIDGDAWINKYIDFIRNIYCYGMRHKTVVLAKAAIISFVSDYKIVEEI